MTVALSPLEATVLFQVLDDSLGVFKKTSMDEEAWKYWALTRERFIQTYSTEAPPYFWFSGGGPESCTLVWASGHPFVRAEPGTPQENKRLFECNRLLRALALHPAEVQSSPPGEELASEAIAVSAPTPVA